MANVHFCVIIHFYLQFKKNRTLKKNHHIIVIHFKWEKNDKTIKLEYFDLFSA